VTWQAVRQLIEEREEDGEADDEEHVDEKVQMAIEDADRALEADWSVEKIREEVNYVMENAG
jgi:hypothetical protein